MNPPQPPRRPAKQPAQEPVAKPALRPALKPMVRKTVGGKKAAPVKTKEPTKPSVGLWKRIPRKLKIGAAIAGVLPALLLLYTGVRAIQYAAAGTPAASRLPADADFVVVAPNFADTYERWSKTGAWDSIQKHVLKDPYVKESVNASLTEAGLPTLDQLDDDRFLQSDEGKMFDPDRLLDLFGRDVAFAAREDGRFVVVTRLSFGQFWAAPFASLAPGVESDDAGLKIDRGNGRSVWVTFDGDLALIADDPGVLDSALRGGYAVKSEATVPILAEVRFRTPAAVEPFHQFIHSFPIGIFGHFSDIQGATGARLTFDMEGAAVKGSVEVIGGRSIAGEGDPLRMLPLVPEGTKEHGTFYVQPTLARGRPLWDWLKQTVLGTAAGPVLDWAKGDLAFTIALATEFGFDAEVLPLLDGPSLIAFGHVPTKHPRAYGEPMLVGAVMFHSSRAEEAESRIDAILDKIVNSEEWKEKQALIRRIQERDSVMRVMGTDAVYESFYFVSPCFTRIGDTIVIATNDEFLRDIIGAAAGARPRFTESGWWPEFRGELEKAGLGDALEPGAVSSGVVHLDIFRASSLVFIAPMVEFHEKTGENMTRIRNRLRDTYRRQGIPITEDQLTQEVMAEIARRVASASDEVRRRIDVLRWYGTLGVRAEPTADGVRVRWAMQLYRD